MLSSGGILEACAIPAVVELAAPQIAVFDASDEILAVETIISRAAFSRYVAKLSPQARRPTYLSV